MKIILRFLGCFIFVFLVIYLFVFVGGWELFESGDPILIEIGVSAIFSVFFFAINEVINSHNKKIKELENRVIMLEEHISNN